MQGAMTVITVVAGMFFSLCFALLLEEWLFGGLFHLFFGSARAQARIRAMSRSVGEGDSRNRAVLSIGK